MHKSVEYIKISDNHSQWLVSFDTEQVEFKNFTSAIRYADSLARRKALVKTILPDKHIIELSEAKRKMGYEFDIVIRGGEA